MNKIIDLLRKWRHSILFLTVAVVIGIALTVGMLFIIQTVTLTHDQFYREVTGRLNELLDTIESTVRISCFTKDQTLAEEIAVGLLKNRTVLGVVIMADDMELVRTFRGTGIIGDFPAHHAKTKSLVRTIYSPFNSQEPVGNIKIYPNFTELEYIVYKHVSLVAISLVLQLIAVIVAIVLVLLKWIVNPITAMSNYLHLMDATAGDRLRLPYGHAHTEIGLLAKDINSLADRLVASLEEERHLRLQREVDERKYRAIFDNAENGIFIADNAGHIDSANPALFRLLVLENHFFSSHHLGDLAWTPNSIHPLELIKHCLEKNFPSTHDVELKLNDGSVRWLNFVINPISGDRVEGIISDITERKQVEDFAKRQVITDHLTGFANRLGFEQILKNSIQSESAFTLMLIDLDGFKRINEALGLPIGDRILKMVSERIKNHLKPFDTLARMGADEFALLLSKLTNVEHLANISRRLVRAIENEYHIDGTPLKLTASIGITIYPQDGPDIVTLLRNAELALHNARTAGGNGFRLFNQEMAKTAERRQEMEIDLQLALKREEFILFFQPIVDIHNNCLAGAEALIRWRHPVKGMVPPDAFIPLVEENGLIIPIGRWCLESACRQLSEWKKSGKDYYLSINISGRQLPQGLTPTLLTDTIRDYDLDPSRLVLELTEGVLMSDICGVKQWLTMVRKIGFPIYLDDFGTGYSSLSYLKKFPLDTLKIDKSFIRDIVTNKDDHILVETIVVMAHTLGMKVVAEGVEDPEQLELLRQMGCNFVQGYYFSRPVPSQEFADVIERIGIKLNS